MFDQQLDVFGGSHDLGPKHEQPRMFEFPKTTPGQMPMPGPDRKAGPVMRMSRRMRPAKIDPYA